MSTSPVDVFEILAEIDGYRSINSARKIFVSGKPITDSMTTKKTISTAARSRTVRRMALVPFVALGIPLGLGLFTFNYGGGLSYFSNDPNACANCHIMQAHFDSWQKSSHHGVATCNDCHLPHDSFFGKWFTKADNGTLHSWAFTTGSFHEPIQIKPRNRRVAQNSCLYCHKDFVHAMLPAYEGQDMLNCIHCHYSVGHAHH